MMISYKTVFDKVKNGIYNLTPCTSEFNRQIFWWVPFELYLVTFSDELLKNIHNMRYEEVRVLINGQGSTKNGKNFDHLEFLMPNEWSEKEVWAGQRIDHEQSISDSEFGGAYESKKEWEVDCDPNYVDPDSLVEPRYDWVLCPNEDILEFKQLPSHDAVAGKGLTMEEHKKRGHTCFPRVKPTKKIDLLTPYNINCWYKPTYENSLRLSIWFVFAKLGAKPRN